MKYSLIENFLSKTLKINFFVKRFFNSFSFPHSRPISFSKPNNWEHKVYTALFTTIPPIKPECIDTYSCMKKNVKFHSAISNKILWNFTYQWMYKSYLVCQNGQIQCLSFENQQSPINIVSWQFSRCPYRC